MNALWLRLRQWTYPADFRIAVDGQTDWETALAGAVSGALADARSSAQTARKRTAELEKRLAESPPEAGVDKDFAIRLCNYLFDLRYNAEQIAGEGTESKEKRSVKRALRKVDELLDKHGIECRDLTGEPYDFARLDFEVVGKPQPVPGLERPTIGPCECPAVLLNGTLIQKARGLVEKPA